MLLTYCTVSLIIIHYLWVSEIVHSQVSPFLLSISAPPSVAVFVAPATSHRRNLAEIAMDNESTETSTPKHSRSEESAGARAAVAPPGCGETPQKRCLTAKHIFHNISQMIVKYCQPQHLILLQYINLDLN